MLIFRLDSCLLFCFTLLHFYFTYTKWFVSPILSCWSFTHEEKVRLNFPRGVTTIYKERNPRYSNICGAAGSRRIELNPMPLLYSLPQAGPSRASCFTSADSQRLGACAVRCGHGTWPQAWSSQAFVLALFPLREIELPIPELVLPCWVGTCPLTQLVPSSLTKTDVFQTGWRRESCIVRLWSIQST